MPIFSQSRDFTVKNGIITESTSEATSSTNNTGIIQSAGGIAAAKNIVVGTTASIYGELRSYSTATFVDIVTTKITASSTSTFIDINVRNIIASGVVSGTITGNINTASNLAGGTLGQIPYQTGVGLTGFLGPGTSGDLLISNGAAAPSYKNTLTLAGTTEATSTNTGALQVRGGAGIAGNLYVGGTLSAGSVLGTATKATTATNLENGSAGQVPYQSAVGVTAFVSAGTAGTIFTANGTSAPTWNNTLVLAGSTQASGTNSGALQVVGGTGIGGNLHVGGTVTVTGAATFNGGATGTITTASNVSGGAVGSIPYQTAAGRTAFIDIGTNGYVLTVNGSTATWQSLSGLSAGTSLTATNISAGTAGQVPYQTAPGATSFFGPGTAGNVLVSNGTNAPSYNNTLTLTGTTAASSTNSGAFQVAGGVGIGGNIYIGGNEDVAGTLTVNSLNANTGTATSNALYVKGGAFIDKTLVVKQKALFEGDVVFAGTATYAYSTNTVITDNLMSLHAPPGSVPGSHTWTLDDGKDIGFLFHYYKAADKDAFLGLANDTGYLEWYDNGSESGGVFSGSSYGTFKLGGIKLVGGAQNTGNTSTGDLTVLGGVGIGGSLYLASTATFNTTILPTSASVNIGSASQRFGTLYVSSASIDVGGLVIGADAGAITLPNVRVTATTVSSSTATGSIVIQGGAGIANNLYVGGLVSIAGATTVTNTTAATSTSTGALQVRGGVGIGGDAYVGGTSFLGTTATSGTVVGFVSNNSSYATYTSPAITTTIQQILDTFNTSTFRTAKYTVQMVDGNNIHAQEMILFHAGGVIYKTEYGIVYNTNELGTFDADISGGNARLLFTANAGVSSLVVKMVRTSITS